MRVEEITTAAVLERLRPDWTCLWQRAVTPGPFQHPDRLLPWWRRLGGGELLVLAARDGAELLALAPFYITADAASGERQLTLLGNGVSDSCDVLLDPGRSGPRRHWRRRSTPAGRAGPAMIFATDAPGSARCSNRSSAEDAGLRAPGRRAAADSSGSPRHADARDRHRRC